MWCFIDSLNLYVVRFKGGWLMLLVWFLIVIIAFWLVGFLFDLRLDWPVVLLFVICCVDYVIVLFDF